MKDFHKHKCHFCSYVWEHHNINDFKHGSGGAHECPSCHRCNWSLGIYTGTEEPQSRNGETPPASTFGLILGLGLPEIHPDQNHYFGD